MPSFEETVVDDGCSFEAVVPRCTSRYTDSAEAENELAFTLDFNIIDAAELVESLTSTRDFIFSDGVEAAETVTPKRTHIATLLNAVYADAVLSAQFYKTVEDAVLGTESSVLSDILFSFLDGAVAANTLLATRSAESSVYDAGTLTEAYGPTRYATVADAVEVLETLVRHIYVVALDEGAGTTSFTATRTHIAELSDAAEATDALTTHLSAVVTILEGLLAAEVIRYTPEELRTAYWVNPLTTATARWSELGVNSIVEVDGRVFGATKDGIVELDMEEGTIEAQVIWDLLDLGVGEKKRAQAAYVGGQSTAPFIVTATTKQGSWEYSTHLADGSEQQENHYTALGRGLAARYFRFALGNTDGAPFDVSEMRVLMGATERRRGG